MGLSWAVLGASWAVLGPSWAVLGPSWGPLGPSWGGLGGPWGRLGASETRKGDNVKNVEQHIENNCGQHWVADSGAAGALHPGSPTSGEVAAAEGLPGHADMEAQDARAHAPADSEGRDVRRGRGPDSAAAGAHGRAASDHIVSLSPACRGPEAEDRQDRPALGYGMGGLSDSGGCFFILQTAPRQTRLACSTSRSCPSSTCSWRWSPRRCDRGAARARRCGTSP